MNWHALLHKEISLRRKDVPREADVERTALDVELEEIKRAAEGVSVPVSPPPPPVQHRQRPPEPEPEPEPETEIAPAAAAAEPAEDKTPFWKKEITLRRKPRVKAEAPVPVPEPEPDAPTEEVRVPFWRKEISLRRKPQAPKTTKKKEKTEDAETAETAKKMRLPKLEARPRVKRDKSGRPLPQRHKKLVGLKIGASQIAAARVSNNGAAELQQLARMRLEPGIVVGGELREPERLAEALKKFFRDNGLPRRGVRLGVANNRIGVRTFEIVGIDDPRQLDNAIRFRAQEALPVPIEEAVLDYQVVGDWKDEEGQTVKRVLLVVAYRELVDRYVSACNKAGIQLVGIDLEAFALLRAMAAPRNEDDEVDAATVVVSVGHDRSTFAVSDGRECQFTRVLDWGGASLNVAIARHIDAAPSEAEPVKHELDLDGTVPPEGVTEAQFESVQDAVRRQIQTFARDLVASLQFYQSQPDSLGIAEIVLTGGGAHLRGLAAELQSLIGVPVRVGDPLARVVVHKKVPEQDQIGSLSVAIGLGIED